MKQTKRMLKSEFEKLTGRTVSDEYYEVVETAYMASSLDKYEFCEAWESASVPVTLILEELTSKIKSLEGEVCHYKEVADGASRTGRHLLEVVNKELTSDGIRIIIPGANTDIDIAVLLKDTSRVLLTGKAYIKECLEKGYSLTDEDRQYLLDLMDHE